MSSEAKTEQASQRKIRQARAKGTVSKSQNLSTYMGVFFATSVLIVTAELSIKTFQSTLDHTFDIMTLPVEAVYQDAFQSALAAFISVALPIFITVLLSAIFIKLIYQGGFVFSFHPLTPKLETISLSKGAKRIFGKQSFVELLISLVRISIWMSAFALFLFIFMNEIISSTTCEFFCIIDVLYDAILIFLLVLFFLLILFAVTDAIIQRALFAGQQKMSKSEVKQERKDQSGSQEIRSARRRFAKSLETSAESIGADKATCAFFFGTTAVAIRYHPNDAPVPKLAAKARKEKESLRLRTTVKENGWKESQNEELVLGLMNIPLGEAVPVELHPALVKGLRLMYSK